MTLMVSQPLSFVVLLGADAILKRSIFVLSLVSRKPLFLFMFVTTASTDFDLYAQT